MQLNPDNTPEIKSQVNETHAIERQVAGLHIHENHDNDAVGETEFGDEQAVAVAANQANDNAVGEPLDDGHHWHQHPHPHFHHRRGHHPHHRPGFPGLNLDGEPLEGYHPRHFEGFEHHHHPGHPHAHSHHHRHHHHHPPLFPPPPFGPGMFGPWHEHHSPPPRPENLETSPEGPWMMGGGRGRRGIRGMHHHGRGMHHGRPGMSHEGPGMGPEAFGPHHWGHCMRPGAFGPHHGGPGMFHRGRGMGMHRGGPPMSGLVAGPDV